MTGSVTGLTACGSGEHEHAWDEGEVTTAPTCTTDGVKTFKCTVKGCEETTTEKVDKIPHAWDEGEITEQPSCEKAGVKTFSCTACTATYTEPVGKTQHTWDGGTLTVIPELDKNGEITYSCTVCDEKDPQPVSPRADFKEQFYTELPAAYSWKYGYAETFDAATDDLTFSAIAQPDEEDLAAWKAEGVEIKAGYIASSANAAVAYAVEESMEINIAASFTGSEENTRLNAYLAVLDGENRIDGGLTKISGEDKDWTYSGESVTVGAGGSLCVVFENAGSGAPSGNFSLTLTAGCLHDFSGAWIGDSADGHYHKCAHCEATDAKVEHTMEDEEVITPAEIGVDGEMKTKCSVCGYESTRVIPALPETPVAQHVKGADYGHDDNSHWFVCAEPTHQDCDYKFEEEAHDWVATVSKVPTLTEDGERTLTCKCGASKKEVITAREDFALSFTTENQDGVWQYGKMNDPWADNRSFAVCTEKTDDAWKADGVEIKAGWINANGETTIAYKAAVAGTAHVKIDFKGGTDNTLLAIRVYKVVDGKMAEIGFNNTKNGEGRQAIELDYEFAANETIYVMFSNEHWQDDTAYPNGALNITVTKQG